MRLRKLQDKDAPFMFEWMHDESVVRYLNKDFSLLTLADCAAFIAGAQDESESIHLAVVDENDEYVGTVSLKHIEGNAAELGIVLRSCAMGKHYALSAMRNIFEYGYKNRGTDFIYWCVGPKNERALRFYDKNGFKRCKADFRTYGYTEEEKLGFIWYSHKINEMEFSNEQSI